ncbi:cytochrome c peroxidase [Methylocapsa polymorpha]|uniref:Cytochrome c peroxidase n=1 Tax=Methylocapsa polymorpha TaxID=3080828 RepID=A0ABZ0HVJ6_9HYPH|nr:cytochrome c peroxidase [Methylocapsa sp. RX1]
MGASLVLELALATSNTRAFPVSGDQTVLPAGTELNEDALDRPREIFRSEATGGGKSYLVKLGDLAFSSPTILGGVARRAGISCNTCHVNGASNPRLYVPGMSTRHGNFDTTGALFNPKADDGVLDPVRTPSLRGARILAPYGNDGRRASLRDFVHNVIVNEFAGPEPSAAILDAMVAYIEDINFLPNPSLGPGGRLVAERTSEAERRGEALFFKPFPHNRELSCAGCHMPSGAFVDHQQHDVGSGGLFKTPTLFNADFNAPYFHDGRFDTYDQVVAYFDQAFDVGLSAQDQRDLVAYLNAVGDGERPYERDGAAANIKEVNDFVSVLDVAIPAHDRDIIALAVDTVSAELREMVEAFPERKDTSVSGGRQERGFARLALKELVLTLRRIDLASAAGRFDDAAVEYRNFRYLMVSTVPGILMKAEPWSLFNPAVHDAHYAALQQTFQIAKRASH